MFFSLFVEYNTRIEDMFHFLDVFELERRFEIRLDIIRRDGRGRASEFVDMRRI